MKRIIFSTIFLLTNISLFAQSVYPYLQAAQPTSVWICWKNETSITPTVNYGSTPGGVTNNTVTGTTKHLGSSYEWNTVKLTGLTPDTGYYYKVNNGTTDSSSIHFFRTPKTYGNNGGKLRFIFLGDHQMINYKGQPWMKYDALVQAAKAKSEERFGTPVGDKIDLIVNDGDQVDWGSLEYYEEVHFKKQRYVSPDIPCITAVGNHELYGTYGIDAYYDHFILDDNFDYQGINSGTERYYAYQMANVLFLVMDSELKGDTQAAWANQIIDAAKVDNSVDWIISNAHRPYQAEQYSNDYLPWYIENVLPNLKTTSKFIMHVAGHHHLYARGQFKDIEAYHMISGGTAWPQYWGDSSNETDHTETQGTWSNFAYQIMEIDNDNMSFDVKSYTIGSTTTVKDNELLDEFHYNRNGIAPDKPTITNTISGDITLPYTFNSSAFATTAPEEDYNSTQFQISGTSDFSVIERELFRNKDNYYGPLNGQTDESQNIGEGLGIFDFTVGSNQLNNGTHYIRVRHRDLSLKWSDWSDAKTFNIIGSVDGEPTISLDKLAFDVNEPIVVSFANGPGNQQDWIGIYGENGVPGGVASTSYQYVDGETSGTRSFSISSPGEYFVSFFENNGYTELTDRIYFYVGSLPQLSTDKTKYNTGENVEVSYTNSPDFTGDWIGVYKVGVEPAANSNEQWKYTDGTQGSLIFENLPDAFYYAVYHPSNGYTFIGDKVSFQVGDRPATISLDKTQYNINEEIQITFSGGPGLEKDYFGIYPQGINPEAGELYTYKYFGGLPSGNTTINGIDGGAGAPNQLPNQVGDYFIVMFTDDSYTEVSNRVNFSVVNPNPSTGGMLNSNIWVAGGLSNGVVNYGDHLEVNDFARGSSQGGVDTGGVYAFETGANDYSLGLQPTADDATPGYIELKIPNNTGTPIKQVKLSYDIKFYNDQDGGVSIEPVYSLDGTNYTALGHLDYITEESLSTSPVWKTINRTTTIDISGTPLDDGASIYIKWNINGTTSRNALDEIAIDNVNLEYAH